MKLQVSLSAFAALMLWANVSNACGSAHDPAPLSGVEQGRRVMIAAEREATFLANAAELAADGHKTSAFASSEWALLLDHEGESFTSLAKLELAAAAVEGDTPVNRLLIEDDSAASVSPEPEVSSHFDAVETPALIAADVTASIPEQPAGDADAVDGGWMPVSLLDHEGDDEIAVANAQAELHVAIAGFILETVPSLEFAIDGQEDR